MPRLRSSVFGIMVLLATVSSAMADLEVDGGRLVFDATVWTYGHVWRAEQAGLAQNEFAIERVAAPVGITGRLSPVASLRVSADVGAVDPLDLYANFRWTNGLNVRAGQFVLPLGFELMTDPGDELIVNRSLLAGYAAPTSSRDIGLMGGVQKTWFSFYGAVVNGSGSNLSDNNSRKDICGRLTLSPLADVDGAIALRAYYGWPGAADTAWLTLATEARLARGPLALQAEFQSHSDNRGQNNSMYVQAAWGIGQVEPVARFDLAVPQGSHSEMMITGGSNVYAVSRRVKMMLDCSYHRNYQANWSVFGVLFRLQATL
jgi:hypothetical protein